MSHVPETQCGAVAKRSTDFATLILRSAIVYAQHNGLSLFVLFVDLVKAFDKVLREIVLGFTPEAARDPVAHFVRL
eukprot:211397-Karenia_brevis.AAC.1